MNMCWLIASDHAIVKIRMLETSVEISTYIDLNARSVLRICAVNPNPDSHVHIPENLSLIFFSFFSVPNRFYGIDIRMERHVDGRLPHTV